MRKSLGFSLAVLALLAFSCNDEVGQTGGCTRDDECRFGRVCMDRLCLYPEEAQTAERLDIPLKRVLDALAAGNLNYLAASWPTDDDDDWAFDFSTGPGNAEYNRRELLRQRTEKLAADFESLGQSRDFGGAEYLGYEAGTLVPIPPGKEHARRGLASLKDTVILYRRDGVEQRLTVSRLLRMRDRYRLFELLP